jgi:uncharacterized damage-inducible protein DinB
MATEAEVKDVFERLAGAPRLLFEVCSGASALRLTRPMAQGKWSLLQTIQHLIGCDREALLPRIEKMLNEDHPFLARFDQDLWMKQYGDVYNRKAVSLLDEYARLREKSMVLLFDLDLASWHRTGQHEERGSITIFELVSYFARHDEHHRRAISDFLATPIVR